METKDWEVLEVGDVLHRYTSPEQRSPIVFQVVRIQAGVATVVRVLDTTQELGQRVIHTEVIEVSREAALRPEWIFTSVRPTARLTGGFLVRRADGTEEYERCPTATTRDR